MKRTIWLLFLLALSVFQAEANEIDFNKRFKLFPSPQKIEIKKGTGLTYGDIRAICFIGIEGINGLDYPLKRLPVTDKEGKGVLTFRLVASLSHSASDEAYVLEVKGGGVAISASGKAGLFYGCQTLLQLLEDANDQRLTIPSCVISDYPDLAYRAVHIDLKHHMNRALYFYDLIDRLARIKINGLIIEFEDKLRYRASPLIGASTALTVEEFSAISRYAQERHIEISALVQGLGHVGHILKHPEYHALRDDIKSDWAFDPLHPGTYKLLFSLYKDAADATPYGKYLHLGGDEVGGLGFSPLAKASGMSPLELQMYWLNKASAFVSDQGRVPMYWDDMLFKLAGLEETLTDPRISEKEVQELWEKNESKLDANVNLFPQNCIYIRWSYSYPLLPGNLNAIDWYKKHGLKAMAATSATSTPDVMMPSQNSRFRPIKEFCKVAIEKKMDGALCTIWDDRSPHFETQWRGLHFFSFFTWNYTESEKKELNAAFRHRFYSPSLISNDFEIQTKLEESVSFWETAFTREDGIRSNYPRNERLGNRLIELPGTDLPGEWSKKYAARIKRAEFELRRYDTVRKIIDQSKKLARRNRYALEVMEQVNKLQIYSSKLLLLLSRYDQRSDATDRKIYLGQIRDLLYQFTDIRTKYEEVYSRATFLHNPEDYLLDMNRANHLANGTKNNDWMYVYELLMNAKIKAWLSGKEK
ncbi:MAG TPA: glycoside hydrolase family 20 zincin-like fold domain-containing protein [Flavitalea sp.]|nr:glycoside hydrolase family 20 zincin-like fold domain-containing protein [Flavitalea sp.]